MKFGLIARSYAPFQVFGGVFHGDGRGPSTRSDVTSRMKAWVVFDPISGSIEEPQARSDRSRWILGPQSAIGSPSVRVTLSQHGRGHLHFRLHVRGCNPMTPRGTPDIDLWLTLTASVRASLLNVHAILLGDQFPNAEVMLQDERGRRQMLMSFTTSAGKHTGPLTMLPGANKRAMNAICRAFALDASGRFR